jgi:hypothetical protein
MDEAYLVLQVIPPIRPSFLHTSLLLKNGVLDGSTQYAEGHGDTVIIVAMDADAFFQFWDGSAGDLQTVVEFFGLHTEFGWG